MFNKIVQTISIKGASLRYAIIPWDSKYLHNTTIEIDEIKNTNNRNLPLLFNKLMKSIHLRNGDLLVCKVPLTSYPIIKSLEQFHFHFMEESITLSIDLTHWNPEQFPNEDEHFYKLKIASKKDKQLIKRIARKTFTSDRFHLDSAIPSKYADYRFEKWIDNSLSSSDTVYKFVDTHDSIIGFFITNETDDVTELRLSGLDPAYTGKGLGKMIYHHVYRLLKTKGLLNVKAVISLNNLPVLNVYTYLGAAKFTEPIFVLHKNIGDY